MRLRAETDPAAAHRLASAVARVVEDGLCSGCGACAQLDAGITMGLRDGFERPAVDVSAATRPREALREFRASCPGLVVTAPPTPPGAQRHPTFGPDFASWRAWATDPEIRHRGSSGGVLTALAAYLNADEGRPVVCAAPTASDPSRTLTLLATDQSEVVRAAGSRYAPVANAASPAALDPAAAVVGKPCEASALRALADARGLVDRPVLLSFFCAGTPSQDATIDLVRTLGAEPADGLRDLWYRGRGWPGRFTAETLDGRSLSTTYQESWGRHLGGSTQWRCKVCVDGVGEAADVSAGDFWKADPAGYPVFEDADGISVLIARTPRGLDLVERAVRDGVVAVEPVDLDELMSMQPYQVSRRKYLLGRLVGSRLAGRRVPTYVGFGLTRSAVRSPRRFVSDARGAFRRVRGRLPEVR